MSVTFISQAHALETVVSVLARHKTDDYYAYERGENWFIGIGNQASLIFDSKGETVTIDKESSQTSRPLDGSSITDVAREFVSDNSKSGCRIFGQAGFNYAAHVRGQQFTPGNWPLLALLVPRIELLLIGHTITLKGIEEEEVKSLYEFVRYHSASLCLTCHQSVQHIDTQDIEGNYTARVEKALLDIAQGQYVKVIPSRILEIEYKIDMPATLLAGRRSNNPARTFSLSHAGYQATGFSPELVFSVDNGRVITEPLAGTRSAKGTEEEVKKLRHELLNDPKEIVEHVISVREAIEELRQLCPPDTIKVEDLMSSRARGSVQHLGSSVAGTLLPEKDMWDAFNVLFPSITASGIPKNAAMEAIQLLEDKPRELYSGAVFMIENSKSFEAALVLRTVFQDENRGWIQAGAGVISQSNPQRELEETREKLASIAPFVIPDMPT
ncbi:uncharacterized protein N7529_001889 [Penicillium soppii]|jgi:salicylate synthetase|uniref:uncharacterized protein n=1 Tax=Penicillium soppii TaxID=69789 RepID=UPI0025484F3E|nr:uncharacterized protein N7529_001889 [Penicillium soppii]KAJ5876305.1 hypothetical protein N7529_001889 [Penicillium soppii]